MVGSFGGLAERRQSAVSAQQEIALESAGGQSGQRGMRAGDERAVRA